VAKQRLRRSSGSKQRERRRRLRLAAAVALGCLVLLFVAIALWAKVWPYVLAIAALAVVAVVGGRLWRTHRGLRRADQQWRAEDQVRAGHRTLTEVDAMSGTEFEGFVAGLCRRDGCTHVQVVGGAGDNGADVRGLLPDGRSFVIQCKRYTPSSAIASREMRDLLGARVHFKADLAIFVTTTRFTRPSITFAREHDILAVHRDHLGLWNSGTALPALAEVNGTGQGDRRHQARWKQTYSP